MHPLYAVVILITSLPLLLPAAQPLADNRDLDRQVQAFLDQEKANWRDLNIPLRDGRYLHDLIVTRRFTRALEIGTSTGHSAIWIAWAMSKTGGKLITIEIDPERYQTALANFKKAGLETYIDARLADAHTLVRELPGPFDFVFSDADKEWYTQYFIDLAPRMSAGGCFTAHNITMHNRGIEAFVEHVQSRTDFTTVIEKEKTSGISITCKNGKAE